jgi:hypothetical protein
VEAVDIQSGTGDLRIVLDGGARKKRRKNMVATIATSRVIRMYDQDRAHGLLFRVVMFGV